MASRIKSQQQNQKSLPGYTVLARRYRSRDFDEIIGQEPIARTLQNAIKTNRTAHAYLFCGTRGVGKTSMARIFARVLNAVDGLSQKKEIGESILRGEDLDVIEIDGASNRGIDEARNLIAGAGLSPTRSPYKIYIIDEVHMLTTPAFNALLKTMEEPPSHVKFILCTTEPHKVPATIQSRCQRFDFRAIPTVKIAEQLKMILKEEGLSADDEVIAQVARLGNGSMRDALSLMDRLLAGGERKITMELVEEMLGLPDHSLIHELVDALVASDPKAALDRGAELLGRGATVEQALELLAEHFRNLMIIAACGEEVEFLDLTEEHKKAAASQAANFDAPTLVHLIAICDAVSRNARTSAASRALFDAAVVRMALSRQFADTSAGGLAKPQTAGARLPGDGESKKKAPDVIAVPQRVRAAKPFAQRSNPPLPQREIRGESDADESVQTRGTLNTLPQRERERVAAISEVKPVADDDLWPHVLEVASRSIGDKTRTEHLVFQSFDGRTLKLSIDDSGADIARYLSRETDRIADLVKRATGRTVRIELDTARFESRASDAPPSAAASGSTPPIIQKAIDLFDATLVSVDEIKPTSAKSS
jgi:DNA polymerase-3 subunit gamma/tau